MKNMDSIAEMLTRIRNAGLARQRTVTIPYSKMRFNIVSLLVSEAYLAAALPSPDKKTFTVTLKFNPDGTSFIQEIVRQSKPSRRLYVSVGAIPRVKNGLGLAIISTPQGLMSDKEARKKHIGGELICTVS
ncbi:30S ribosomal protein S8 [Candidatus Parcubacteria bacterium]|nr:MAG: 30S ribosomal protein S8 [Candidatus Parcubacteria bacterium]